MTSYNSKVQVQIHELRFESTSDQLKSTSYEFKSTSYEIKCMSCEFLSTSYKFIYTSYEFKFLSNKFKCFSYEFKSASYEFKSTSYEFKSTSSSTIKSIKKISKQAFKTTKGNSFPKVVSSKLLRQHVISTCGGNLSHYVAATPWLWLQQDAE